MEVSGQLHAASIKNSDNISEVNELADSFPVNASSKHHIKLYTSLCSRIIPNIRLGQAVA
jgi:hypothetical protein